jgi:hypothetical protein
MLPGGLAADSTGCDTNGLIARRSDGSGALMNCINNVWTRIGGGADSLNYYYIGSGISNYNGSNPTSHTMWAMVSTVAWGGSCANTDFGVLVYVNGNLIGNSVSEDSAPNETTTGTSTKQTVTIAVPAGASYQVVQGGHCAASSTIWEYR